MQNVLRTWPYFKFYVYDWLTSNRIKLMTASQVGAYIGLLCNAWTEESCTLPTEPQSLKILAKWNDEIDGDFGPVLACFPLTRNQKRRYNHRLFAERQEALAYRTKQSEGGRKGMESRWAAKSVVREKRTTEKAPPIDWLITIRANPAYKHLNIDIELAKMDAWLSTKPGRKKTKSFVVNWLNKIEPPLGSNGHGKPTPPPFPPKTDPIARGQWRQAYGDPRQYGYEG